MIFNAVPDHGKIVGPLVVRPGPFEIGEPGFALGKITPLDVSISQRADANIIARYLAWDPAKI